jgi:hypothetical protein
MTGAVSRTFVAMGKWLRDELVAICPVFLFFLVGFLLLTSLIKLALSQFSIEIGVISNAVLGALLAAKATLLVEETPLVNWLEDYRRIIAVVVKVLFYGATCLLLLYVERLLEAFHKVHNVDAAYRHVLENATRYRVLVWTLGISIVFALYFVFLEISESLGQGKLWRLFMEPPTAANDSRATDITAIKRRS